MSSVIHLDKLRKAILTAMAAQHDPDRVTEWNLAALHDATQQELGRVSSPISIDIALQDLMQHEYLERRESRNGQLFYAITDSGLKLRSTYV